MQDHYQLGSELSSSWLCSWQVVSVTEPSLQSSKGTFKSFSVSLLINQTLCECVCAGMSVEFREQFLKPVLSYYLYVGSRDPDSPNYTSC